MACRLVTLKSAVTIAVLVICADGAQAACNSPDEKPSTYLLSVYVDVPEKLVNDYPLGGEPLAGLVASLVGHETRGLPTVMAASRIGSRKQREAIGLGLARASLVCSRSDPARSQAINRSIGSSGDQSVKQTFRKLIDEVNGEAPATVVNKRQMYGASEAIPLTGSLTDAGAASKSPNPFAPLP